MTATSPRLSDYDFELPPGAIAQAPSSERTGSRLLCWMPGGDYEHRRFADVVDLLRPEDLLVLNDTKVFAARLLGRKVATDLGIEALLLKPMGEASRWEAMVRPGRRLRPGTQVEFEGGARAIVGDVLGDGRRILEFDDDRDGWQLCEQAGHVPLPPYIERPDDERDTQRYQTVFAAHRGSVAAPTAGLHFDRGLLGAIEAKGVSVAELTLHVGPGTFQPLDEDRLRRGELHAEEVVVPAATLRRIAEQRARGGRIVAVGTTVCRSLESLEEDALSATGDWRRRTRLMIAPGFEYRYVDVLITNFHLPRSSLLLLVAALAGSRWREAYELALAEGYRFYSYGDANWIERARQPR